MAYSEAGHKHAGDILVGNEAQLLAVWEYSADAMSLSDPEGIVLAANPAYYQLYGYSADEVLGHSFSIIFPPETRNSAIEQYKDIFQSAVVPPAYESVVRHADGTMRVVESRIGFVQQDGRRSAMLSMIRDVTSRVQLEEERDELLSRERQARTAAEEAVRSRDRFLSIVSHDLKNPLAAIKANAQLLKRHINNSASPKIERLNDGLSKIDDTVTRMSLALDDLMDFAGLQAGQSLSLQRKVTDIVALARRVAADLQGTTERHRISFEADPGKLVGVWDANRLQRALENVLSNAIKYSPGGGEIKINISANDSPQGRKATITVSDPGLGISPDDQPHIFEWFRRGGSVADVIGGTGIGLASARYIVEQHGGTITVESQLGKGSTFTITMPLNTQG